MVFQNEKQFGNRRREEIIFAPLEEAYFLDYCEEHEVVSCNRMKEGVTVHM